MISMAITIYFGYVNAYKLNTNTYDVYMFGINIFKLKLNDYIYNGYSIGSNMGIISIIYIIIAIVIEEFIDKLKCKKPKVKK